MISNSGILCPPPPNRSWSDQQELKGSLIFVTLGLWNPSCSFTRHCNCLYLQNWIKKSLLFLKHIYHIRTKVSIFLLRAQPQPTRESSRVPPTLVLSSSPSPEQSCIWPVLHGKVPPVPQQGTPAPGWPPAPHLGSAGAATPPSSPGVVAGTPKLGVLQKEGEIVEGFRGVEGTSPLLFQRHWEFQAVLHRVTETRKRMRLYGGCHWTSRIFKFGALLNLSKFHGRRFPVIYIHLFFGWSLI